MAAPEASASVLAWSWVIEALATSPNVALSTLHDLIGSTPNLSANLGKEAREMVALRCLEGLYYPDKGFKTGTSLPTGQKGFEFDSCESFEHVLQRVVEQTSMTDVGKSDATQLANMRKATSDKLVKEVHAFIDCRKTSLPKCALEQLKERLQRGDVSPATNTNKMTGPEAENTSPDKRLNLSKEQSACATPVSLKRHRSTFQTETHVHELMHDENDAIADAEHYSPPLAGVEVSEDASRRNVLPAESEVPEAAQEVQMESEGREHARSTRPRTCDQPDVCVKCKEGGKLLTCANSCQMLVHESCLGVPTKFDSKGDFICPLCAHSQALSEYAKAKKDMLLAKERLFMFVGTNLAPWQLDQLKVLLDINVHPQMQGKNVDKGVEVTSAQTISNDQEPVELARPCEDVPSKQKGASPVDRASKDKQQQENLVPGSADNSPTCSFKGEDEGEEPVEPARPCEDVPSKQKGASPVDRASKDKQQQENLVPGSADNAPTCSFKEGEGEGEEPVEPARPCEDVPSKQKGAHPGDRASKDKQQQENLVPGSADSAPTCSLKEGEVEREDITAKMGQNAKGLQERQIEDFTDAGLHGNPKQQLHGPSTNAGTREAGNLKRKRTKSCSRPQAERKLANQRNDALNASLGGHDRTSQEEICKETTSKHSLRQQSKQKPVDLPANLEDASNASDNDSDDTATSQYSLRNRGKRISHYHTIPTTPQERRIRLKWTAEEVEMLKEGVKRFASRDMKVIPWTAIFDFGSSVFLKGRTTVDLKDKWRNLVRSSQTRT